MIHTPEFEAELEAYLLHIETQPNILRLRADPDALLKHDVNKPIVIGWNMFSSLFFFLPVQFLLFSLYI